MLPFSRSASRRIALLAAATLLPIAFNGCFSIKMRELRTEVQMKEARIQQLNQDMAALTEAHAQAQQNVLNLTRQLAAREADIVAMKAELGTTAEKLSTTRVALNTSLESTKKELGNRLAATLENEQQLRAEIDQLQNTVASLQTDLLGKEEDHKELSAALEQARADLSERADLIERLQASLEERAAEVATLREENAKATTDLQASHESTLTSLRSENEKLLAETRTANEAEIKRLSDANALLEKDLADTRTRMETLAGEMKTLNDLAAERTRTTVAFEQQITELTTQLSAREEAVKSAAANAAPRVSAEAIDKANALATENLAPLVNASAARIEKTESGLRIHLFSDEVFQPGTTLLSDTGLRALQQVDKVIQQLNYDQIIVAGHTDNVPVRNMPYPDNWELAGARAAEMVRWLAAQPGSKAGRLVAQSHAYHQPMGDNTTAAGRRVNRRVEIVVHLAAQ